MLDLIFPDWISYNRLLSAKKWKKWTSSDLCLRPLISKYVSMGPICMYKLKEISKSESFIADRSQTGRDCTFVYFREGFLELRKRIVFS